MPCFANGVPIPSTSATVRYRENDEAIATATETIAISFVAPSELQMEQLTCHWGAIPTTAEDITLTKISVEGFRYDTVLRAEDPSVNDLNVQDIVCVIPFRFAQGDTVSVTYPNTDNLDVGCEIMLKAV